MATQFGRPHYRAGGPPAAGKKLVIKPLKAKPKLPENFADVTWAKLRTAVLAVLNQQPVACSLEELYRCVEDMCVHKLSAQLYEYLRKEADMHIESKMKELSAKASADEAVFLQQVEGCWSDLCAQLFTIRSIFLYLDRTYVLGACAGGPPSGGSGARSLFDMGVALFRTHLESHAEVQRKTVGGMLNLIKAERRGEAADRVLLRHLTSMFATLGVYSDAFQGPFLSETSAFYDREGSDMLATSDVPDYLLHAERRLREEYERCEQYLDSITRKPLIAAVEAELLEKHVGAMLSRGFKQMVDEGRLTDLARLYTLTGRVAAHDAVRIAFRAYIKEAGSALVLDEEKDKDMITLLLALKRKLDSVVAEPFCRNEAFAAALKDAFEQFVNQRQNKPAELLAKFIDSVMKSGAKGSTEEELEATLDAALVVFRFISGKDVFEAFYKKDLAKRLLLGRSASIDAEKSMISKLKAECGSAFTNKLEGMFKDVDLSKDILAGFKQSSSFREKVPGSVDTGVSVLTSGYWPTYPVSDMKLPEELSQCQQAFKEYYLSKHSGRRLVWYNGLGTCVLKAHFPACGARELQVSLMQATVLCLFDDKDSMTYREIADASGIEEGELKRTLQSLACSKPTQRVLLKEPAGREVDDTDSFRFNDKFTTSLYRVKINTIQLKETVEENRKTNEQVLQDRQYQVDAAIVRIMKTRKTLSHKLLMQELLVHLKFPVSQADLKKRVESLIDREYMERDENNANVYNYLA